MSNAAVFADGVASIMLDPEFIPNLPIELIDVLENARSNLGDLTELTASIVQDGVLQAITVYRDGDRFVVWLGHRRLDASKLAGKLTIPAMVHPKPDPKVFLSQQVVENVNRSSMPDPDVFRACVKLESLGMTRAEIAKSFGKSASQVNQYLAPAHDKFPPEAMEAFLSGQLPLGKCYSIVNSPIPLETLRLVLGGATREQLKGVKKTKGEKSTTERHEKLIIPFSKAAVIAKARKGEQPLNLSTVRQLLADAITKVDKAINDGLGVKSASLTWQDTKNKAPKFRKKRQPKQAAD